MKRIFVLLMVCATCLIGQAAQPKIVKQQPKVLWTVATKSDSKGSAAVADIDGDGKLEIVFGTYFNDRHIYAVSAEDGKDQWKFQSDRGPLDASVAIADIDKDGKFEVLAADSSSGNLFCLDGQGKEKWRLRLPNSTDSPPAIADLDGDGTFEIVVGSMWLGDRKGHVCMFSTATKETRLPPMPRRARTKRTIGNRSTPPRSWPISMATASSTCFLSKDAVCMAAAAN